MMRYVFWIAMLLGVVSIAGCGGGTERTDEGGTGMEAAHDHGHEGVHGGQVIELGDENYHAELVHDDATHKVGVYMLDGTVKNPAPIDAESVTVNCRIDEKPAQFTLAAVPQAGDPAGKSSYFELVNEDLVKAIDNPDAVARLSIMIEGKPYVGLIETHGHEQGHDHGHEH